MRINFKRGSYFKDTKRSILKELTEQLCNDYDLEVNETTGWIKTKSGLDMFINYLTEKGYKVKSYTWPTDKDPKSFGLEFDDDDPLIIALNLKHGG